MLRYTVSFASSFIAAVAAVAAVNYAIDADELYHKRTEIGGFAWDYVERLLRSADGLVLVAHDRSIKLELARRSGADCVVIGSSREMQLDLNSAPQMFGACKAVVNLAVLGAGFEDFVAGAGVILRRDVSSTVYVGVYPWTLRRRHNQRFAEERGAYEEARAVIGLKPDSPDWAGGAAWYLNLFGADYLLRNIAFMLQANRRNDNMTAHDRAIRDGQSASDSERIMEPNGIILQARRARNRPPSARPAGVSRLRWASETVDASAAREFEQVLSAMVQRGVRVKLLLMPYHPAIMNCAYERVCRTLSTMEAYLRGLGLRLGLDVIGSFDPRPFAVAWSDFWDFEHLRMEALRNVRTLTENPWARSEPEGSSAN
jgi:hypothetical protein